MVSREVEPQAGDTLVLVGTRQGSLLLWSDRQRRQWRQRAGQADSAVHALTYDQRDGRLYAAVNTADGRFAIERSDDGGRGWQRFEHGLESVAADEEGARQVWQVQPGHTTRPGEVWAGLRAASLYRSADWGCTWQPVTGLNNHATRPGWAGGGGGLILHTIVLDSQDARRLYAGISAAGVFRSEDGGTSWHPINRGVRADFYYDERDPERSCYPETGQCVHKFALHPAQPAVLFQVNHCGVYRSDNYGTDWLDISDGLPSRFGFGLALHPRSPTTLYVVPLIADDNRTAPDGQLAVWRSRDAGQSWHCLTQGLPAGPRLAVLRDGLATADGTPAGVYLGTTDGRVYGSQDEGDHWQVLADGLPPVLSVKAVQLS